MNSTSGLNPLREELIASLHSNSEAQSSLELRTEDPQFAQQLVEVCFPCEEYSNDPRMEAAYYLSKCPAASLLPIAGKIEELLALPNDGETMNGNISFHLVACIRRLIAEVAYAPTAHVHAMCIQE